MDRRGGAHGVTLCVSLRMKSSNEVLKRADGSHVLAAAGHGKRWPS
jgi:hypothetical protein